MNGTASATSIAGTLLPLLLPLLSVGCGSATEPAPPTAGKASLGPPVVVVTSYPLYAMAQEISAGAVVVKLPATSTPRSWQPMPDDIHLMQSADLILLNGAGYEPWVQNLSLPRSRTIDTSSGYRDQLLHVTGVVTHQHGPRGAGSTAEVAWGTWLDPELATAQLRKVEQQLTQLVPDKADEISQRVTAFGNQLEQLRLRLDKIAAAHNEEVVVLTDGPFYSYLVSRLHWKLHSVKFSRVELPDADQAEELVAAAEKFKPKLLLYRRKHSGDSMSAFKYQGVASAAIDLCEAELRGTSLIARLTGNIDAIEAALELP